MYGEDTAMQVDADKATTIRAQEKNKHITSPVLKKRNTDLDKFEDDDEEARP